MAAYVCAKVSPPREEVRLLGRSRRAGTNQRSVANSRGDAVAHVPPERSEWRGPVLGKGAERWAGIQLHNGGGAAALAAASSRGAAEHKAGGLST